MRTHGVRGTLSAVSQERRVVAGMTGRALPPTFSPECLKAHALVLAPPMASRWHLNFQALCSGHVPMSSKRQRLVVRLPTMHPQRT